MVFAKPAKERNRWWRFRWLTLSRVAESLHHPDFKTHFAGSRAHYAAAFHLAYQRYREVGIIAPHTHKLWLTPFHALEDTRVALCHLGGTAACTATIVFDSEFGLPSDDVYSAELNTLRREGRKLAEFCSLATLQTLLAQNALFSVYRFLFRYAVSRGCTDIVISIRPKHSDFYSKIMLFKTYGPLRSYPKFIEVQALLQRLEVEAVKLDLPKAYHDFPDEINMAKYFLTESIGDQEKEFSRCSGLRSEDLAFFLEKSSLGHKLSADFKAYCHQRLGSSSIVNAET